MSHRVSRGWLVAAAWAGLAGGAIAQPPAGADPSPIAAALFPTSAADRSRDFDPALSSYVVPPPGWFVQSEADVAKPHVTRQLAGDTLSYGYDPPLAAAKLGWGTAGQLGVGYLTADADGLLLSFRGGSWAGQQRQGREAFGPTPATSDLWAGGTSAWTPDDGTAWARDLHTYLSFARLDLDYLGGGWPVADCARMGWSAGLRGAWLSAGYSADDTFGVVQRTVEPLTGFVLSQSTVQAFEHKAASLSVVAGGFHLAADGTWALGETGLCLCVGADGGLLIGHENARYSHWENATDVVFGPRASDVGTALLGTFNARAGVQYVAPWRRGSLRLGAGYQFETWGLWRPRTGGGAGFGSVAPSETPHLFDTFSWGAHGAYLSCEFTF